MQFEYVLRPVKAMVNWWFIRALALVILVFIASGIRAQKSALTWSDAFRVSQNEDYMGIVGHDESGFYAVRQLEGHPEAVTLDRYAFGDMQRSFSKTIPMPIVGNTSNHFEMLVHLGGGFMLFSSAENKATAKFEIYCTALDRQGEQVVKPVLLHFIDQENYRAGTKLDIAISPDSSKFMVFFDSPFERRAKETFQLRVYSTDFDLLWQKDLELPYAQNVVQVNNYLLGNNGDLFLMSGWAPEKNAGINRFQRPQDGRYVLFHYGWEENKLKEFDVSLRDKSIVSVIPRFAPNGDMVIGGFYSNDYLFSVAGTFLFILNPLTDQVKTATMVPFTKEFLSLFINERSIEKGNDLSDFYLDHLYIEPNGEVTMLGEKFYLSERIVNDPTTGRQTVEYMRNFDDILAVKLDSAGFMKWHVKIAKQQSATDLGTNMSYSVFTSADGIHLFFNDDPENTALLNANPQAMPKGYTGERNSVTAQVVLSRSDGAQVRSVVSNNKEVQYHLRPGYSYDFQAGPIILGFQESKNMKYAILKR